MCETRAIQQAFQTVLYNQESGDCADWEDKVKVSTNPVQEQVESHANNRLWLQLLL